MRFHITLTLVAVLLLGSAGAANAQGETEGTGRLQFVHAAESAPAFGIDLFAPQGGLIGMFVAEPGTTTDLVPEAPLTAGRYQMTILPPGGGATGGGEILTIDSLLISPGFTTVVTAYADERGFPLFVAVTAEGETTYRPSITGTLVFQHDLDDGAAIEVVVLPFEEESEARSLGSVAPGGQLQEELDHGTHTLLLQDQGVLLGTTAISIREDEVTVVRASAVVQPRRPSASPRPTPAPIRTPTRVDTGGGGAADRAVPLLLLGLAALTGAGAAALATPRKQR